MWKTNEINIGRIKIGEVKKVVFEYEGNQIISRVVPGCGCSDAVLKDNVITVTLRIKDFPKHLKNVYEVNIKKNIVVYYKDVIRPEVLYIAGKLIQI
jgi:hypothetical protein